MLFLLYGQYDAGATLERTAFTLYSLACREQQKLFSPTSTLDVALQIQSVALELHHPCLVFTQSAHRTWFPFVMFTTEVETGGCCHLSSVQHDLSMMSMFYNLTLLLEMCSVVSMSHTFECFSNPFVLKGIATQIEHAPVFWGSV